jgi:hypothetical protein
LSWSNQRRLNQALQHEGKQYPKSTQLIRADFEASLDSITVNSTANHNSSHSHSPQNLSTPYYFDYTAFYDLHINRGRNWQPITDHSISIRDWTGVFAKMDEYPIGCGSFADVYRGKCVLAIPGGVQTPLPVAIKIIRPVGNPGDSRLQKAMIVSDFSKTSLFKALNVYLM